MEHIEQVSKLTYLFSISNGYLFTCIKLYTPALTCVTCIYLYKIIGILVCLFLSEWTRLLIAQPKNKNETVWFYMTASLHQGRIRSCVLINLHASVGSKISIISNTYIMFP